MRRRDWMIYPAIVACGLALKAAIVAFYWVRR